MLRKGFGLIAGIELDLTGDAPFFADWGGKTDPGSIKKYRKQRVYHDFTETVAGLLEEHTASMAARGLDTGDKAPVFVNRQGSPMTVQTYSDRVKTLFYKWFMPALRATCEKQGIYAEHAAFIDAYEAEYPGAHMFRHWFTMYLLTKAGLTNGEIMRWRGDSSQESMNEYIHENADMVRLFRETSYSFQAQILENAGKEEM
jgi:integrase